MLFLRRPDMFIIKAFLKVMLIPVILLLTLLRILVGIGNKLVSVPLGLSLLIVFACIVFAGSQKMWSSMLKRCIYPPNTYRALFETIPASRFING